MSYYFTLQTQDEFPLKTVLETLNDPDVRYMADDPEVTVLYRPGKSVRGVCVYGRDDGIEIGLNAWTTYKDAELARDVVTAAAKVLQSNVLAENDDILTSADAVYAFCDSTWLEQRYQEAGTVMRMITDDPADETMNIMGYRRNFAFSRTMYTDKIDEGASEDEAIAFLMQEAMTLQEIDQVEDIFAPNHMIVSRPAEVKKSKWFRRTTEKPAETISVYSLAPGVRTLIPVILSDHPIFAIMGNKDIGIRRVENAVITEYARRVGAREFGVGAFDLTIDGHDYDALYRQGQLL